jgi:ferritin heavy chain
MDYVIKRGGRVRLQSILAPETEFGASGKEDALYALELALSLEKLNFAKLRALHDVAAAAGDASMTDFVEGDLLGDQVASVKAAADAVAQLRRVGPGLGVWEFDRRLQEAAA